MGERIECYRSIMHDSGEGSEDQNTDRNVDCKD
jgi:hypothetical protein